MSGNIYTAQYNYDQNDRIDITYKTDDPYFGSIFKPTKHIVFDYKDGHINEETYSKIYHKLMLTSYHKYKDRWHSLMKRPSITFVCYCKAGDFCHRLLLAGYFAKLGAKYKGERTKVSKLVWSE